MSDHHAIAKPTEEETKKWHRRMAVDCNGRGWTLSEMPTRTAAEDEEMLHAAHGSCYHWSKIGTPHNRALGVTLLGRVYSILGHSELAMKYANEQLDYFLNRESEGWELAFAHAIMAGAAHCARDCELHASHFQQSKEFASKLTGEDLEIFEATFRNIPKPQPLSMETERPIPNQYSKVLN